MFGHRGHICAVGVENMITLVFTFIIFEVSE